MGGSLGSIDNSQDGIIIRSLVPLLHGFGLLHPNFVHDEDLVVFLDLLSKETGNSLVFRFKHEVLPVDSSDAEPFAVDIGFVVKLRSLVVSDVVGSD